MSKSVRHYKKSKRRGIRSAKKIRETRTAKIRRSGIRKIRIKTRRIRSRKLKAGNGEKVLCSMCEKEVSLNDTLVPRECLMKHGKAAHRICKKCWWDPKIGFALESSSHKCPGCQKGLPLTAYKKEEPVLIDLTED
jgi:hypothetical protein